MRYLLLLTITLFLFASNNQIDTNTKKNIQQQLEKEKKYAKEQKFYDSDNYDFRSAEVDPNSLHKIDALEPEDLDMDDVYD
jgi:Flp pilus assembly CpaE family ATPase